MYAGFANGYMNRFTYLYKNGSYWTMSPFYFDATDIAANEFRQSATGTAAGYGLRPVSN